MAISVRRLDAPTVRERTDGGFAPLLRCDECGEEIRKPASGRAAWDIDENATYLGVAFLHEGCVEAHRGTREVRLRVDRLSNVIESLAPFLPRDADGDSG